MRHTCECKRVSGPVSPSARGGRLVREYKDCVRILDPVKSVIKCPDQPYAALERLFRVSSVQFMSQSELLPRNLCCHWGDHTYRCAVSPLRMIINSIRFTDPPRKSGCIAVMKAWVGLMTEVRLPSLRGDRRKISKLTVTPAHC